jgi:hypothetical protein
MRPSRWPSTPDGSAVYVTGESAGTGTGINTNISDFATVAYKT